MRMISIHNPEKLVFGVDSLNQMVADYIYAKKRRIYILSAVPVIQLMQEQVDKLKSAGIELLINTSIAAEPTFSDFDTIVDEARSFSPDSVAGIGGGSVMDVAKLVATFIDNEKSLKDFVGIGLIKSRDTHLVCVPTTSGTGSEVSPNSILLDDINGGKKGIISPYLMPDATYVDPALTTGLPTDITAYTGIDALTHCIEAYANKYAHPLIDTYALKGIELIAKNIKQACTNGSNIYVRSNVSMGSMFGGICLGPVNTAAVHALAYPLGSDFKIAHGLSNALLLPYIIEYNMPEAIDRYADIAIAMGIKNEGAKELVANAGLEFLKELNIELNIPSKLSAIGVEEKHIEDLAKSALEVQRLLKNNVREVTLKDAMGIYTKAL